MRPASIDPAEPKRAQLEVRVSDGTQPMTEAQLEAWADQYIGYILEREGLTSLPADSDHEAA